MTSRFDRLGLVIAGILVYGGVGLPFTVMRANRIVPGQGLPVTEALPTPAAILFFTVMGITLLIAVVRTTAIIRLGTAAVATLTLALMIGFSALYLTPEGNSYARVSPASGFWVMFFATALMATDAVTRLKPGPGLRVLFLIAASAAIFMLLGSGAWSALSLLKEYGARADSFWSEAGKHVLLALGSLLAAVTVGLPLGILCHRIPSLRAGILSSLNLIQTIPSIALFGLLIGPLGWVAANVPGASSIGIRGIGMAPAFMALFLYSLLPVVANTVAGLAGISREANEAARGIGMTGWQRLSRVELPLAFPVILTGVRIVLVQNIGLATIAALIGGGGFGVFVFQGIGQTAMDLVLLGAIPTVFLAFAAAVVLDALIEKSAPASTGKTT